MTKEEIRHNNNIYFLNDSASFDSDNVDEAMEEYAKQEAIEFVEFCNVGYWRSPLIQGGLWYDYYTLDMIGVIPDSSKGFTSEGLYELFIQSKEKQ